MTNEGAKLASDVHAMIQKAWNEGHAAGEKLGHYLAIKSGFSEAATGLALVVGFALGFAACYYLVAA